jgi:hypothetical protein
MGKRAQDHGTCQTSSQEVSQVNADTDHCFSLAVSRIAANTPYRMLFLSARSRCAARSDEMPAA